MLWSCRHLTVLEDTPNSSIDLIFVHGLTGNHAKFRFADDWRGSLWPTWLRESGTPTIPNARVFEFGKGYLQDSHESSLGGLLCAGRQLWTELQEARRCMPKERPIILVTHSLGDMCAQRDLLRAFADVTSLNTTFGLVFIREADIASFLKQPPAAEQIMVTSSRNAYFESTIHKEIEGFSEAFKLLAGTHREIVSEFEVVSLYGYTYFKNLMDEALLCTLESRSQIGRSFALESADKAFEYISSRVFRIINRTTRVLYSQIEDTQTTMEAKEVLRCEKGAAHYGRVVEYLSQPPWPEKRNTYNPLTCIKDRGTMYWLLERPEYASWIQNDCNSIFWLSGSAGSGKSVLTSLVLEDLKQKFQGSTRDVIASYFYDPRYRTSASAAMVLKEMIHGVLPRQNQAPARARLQSILLNLEDRDNHISTSQLRSYLSAIRYSLAAGESMYLIIDGLDQADEPGMDLLEELIYVACRQNDSRQIKCFISSRSRWNRYHCLEGGIRINIDQEPQAREDLADFIRDEAESSIKAKNSRDIFSSNLRLKAQGIFLWATLAIRSLSQSVSSNQGGIQSLVDTLPTTTIELCKWMLLQIPEEDQYDARNLLTFLVYAARPLHVLELLALMNLDIKDILPQSQKTTCFIHRTNSMEEYIRRLSGGLATIDKDDTVNLVHVSVKDYLRSQHSNPALRGLCMSENYAHQLLTQACFYFLRPDQMRRSIESTELMSQQPHLSKDNQPSFIAYAIQYWPFHYRIAETQSDHITTLLHRMLHRNLIAKHCEACAAQGISSRLSTQDFVNMSLGIGISHGFEKLVRMLLEMGADPNFTVNSDGMTPLHLSAKTGNSRVVELLLQRGADIEQPSLTFAREPLYYASAGGHHGVMKILLNARENAQLSLTTCHNPNKYVPLCTVRNVHGLLSYMREPTLFDKDDNENTMDLCLQAIDHINELSQRLSMDKERLEILSKNRSAKLHKSSPKDPGVANPRLGNLGVLQHVAREVIIQQLLQSGSWGVWRYRDECGLEDFSSIESCESKFQLTLQLLLDVVAKDEKTTARNWGTALEVAIERGQEESIRTLLEHESVLPPNITIGIQHPYKTRLQPFPQGPDPSLQPEALTAHSLKSDLTRKFWKTSNVYAGTKLRKRSGGQRSTYC